MEPCNVVRFESMGQKLRVVIHGISISRRRGYPIYAFKHTVGIASGGSADTKYARTSGGLHAQSRNPPEISSADALMSTHWKPGNFLLAQDAHIFFGAAWTFAAVAFHLQILPALGALLAVTLAKEFGLDRVLERQLPRAAAVDFAFYWMGAGAALFVLLLTHLPL